MSLTFREHFSDRMDVIYIDNHHEYVSVHMSTSAACAFSRSLARFSGRDECNNNPRRPSYTDDSVSEGELLHAEEEHCATRTCLALNEVQIPRGNGTM